MPVALMLATLADRRKFDDVGVTNPSPEQAAADPVVYCVFDLLELDGEDLTDPAAARAPRAAALV